MGSERGGLVVLPGLPVIKGSPIRDERASRLLLIPALQVAKSADYRGVQWLGIPRRAKLPVRFYAHDTIGVIAHRTR